MPDLLKSGGITLHCGASFIAKKLVKCGRAYIGKNAILVTPLIESGCIDGNLMVNGHVIKKIDDIGMVVSYTAIADDIVFHYGKYARFEKGVLSGDNVIAAVQGSFEATGTTIEKVLKSLQLKKYYTKERWNYCKFHTTGD
jgi:hypothetical protein